MSFLDNIEIAFREIQYHQILFDIQFSRRNTHTSSLYTLMHQENDKNYETISSIKQLSLVSLGDRTDHLQEYMLVKVIALFTLGQCFVGLTEL